MNKGINFKIPPTKHPNVRVSNLWPLRRVEQCIGWLTNTKTPSKGLLEKVLAKAMCYPLWVGRSKNDPLGAAANTASIEKSICSKSV